MGLDTDRKASPAAPIPTLSPDGRIHAPITDKDGNVKGHRRKTVSDLTFDELKAMAPHDVVIVAGALIGVLHAKESELASATRAHAMAERNYWSLKLDNATKEVARAEALVRDGNT